MYFRKKRSRYGRTTSLDSQPRGRRGRTLPVNYKLMLVTAILGAVAWLICNIVYNAWSGDITDAVIIGTVFAILYVIVSGGVFVMSNNKGSVGGLIFAIVIGGAIAMFGLGALLQWIYGLNVTKKVDKATSYIFVIDDSGSTSSTDPENLRYKAISDVLEGMDETFPYMVYGFADEVTVLRDMAPISEGEGSLIGQSSGGTFIKHTLADLIYDYKQGIWDGGEHPKVILLTDGYASDVGLFNPITKVLKEYKKENISISTVGFEQVDKNLMEKIAKTTGGVFVNVDDASQLSEALEKAATEAASRDLVSMRQKASFGFLYAIMRIVFIVLLGCTMGILVAVAYGHRESFGIIGISTLIKAIIGAFIMEVGTSLCGFSEKFMWLLLWILLALTIAWFVRKVLRPIDDDDNDWDNNGGSFSPASEIRERESRSIGGW